MSVSVKRSSSAAANVTFDEPGLILVEGGDDQAVIAAMIKYENLPGFQVHNMSGNASWTSRVAVIMKAPEFEINVKAIGLVRDADNGPGAAWDSCVSALKACSFAIPASAVAPAGGDPVTAIFVTPSRHEMGAIEELCAKSFDSDRTACVDSYFECLRGVGNGSAGGKGRSQAYLAGLSSAPRDLAVAANRGLLDMGHQGFDELREFIRGLAATFAADR